MTEWSYIVTDGRHPSAGGGLLIDAAAPYTAVKWSDGVDQGNLTATIALDAIPAAQRLDYFDIDRTIIWPCADGTPVGAWVVTSQQPRKLGDDVVQVVAQPALWRLLEGRTVRSTLIFQQVDQLNMARDLIRYAVGVTTLHTSAPQPIPKNWTYGAPWLRLAAGLSSRAPRDRLDNTDGWQAAGRKTLATCLRSLMELVDGFEVVTVAGLDAATRMPYLEVRFGDPEVGEPGVVGTLEWPGAVVTAGTYGVDGSDRAALVEAIGAKQEPNTQLIAAAQNTDDLLRRIPREVAFSAGEVTLLETLTAHAQDELTVNGPPVTGFSLTLGGVDAFAPYTFAWGSRFRLAIDDPGFPAGADGRPFECIVRCRGADIEVGGFGKADTVRLSLQVEGGI